MLLQSNLSLLLLLAAADCLSVASGVADRFGGSHDTSYISTRTLHESPSGISSTMLGVIDSGFSSVDVGGDAPRHLSNSGGGHPDASSDLTTSVRRYGIGTGAFAAAEDLALTAMAFASSIYNSTIRAFSAASARASNATSAASVVSSNVSSVTSAAMVDNSVVTDGGVTTSGPTSTAMGVRHTAGNMSTATAGNPEYSGDNLTSTRRDSSANDVSNFFRDVSTSTGGNLVYGMETTLNVIRALERFSMAVGTNALNAITLDVGVLDVMAILASLDAVIGCLTAELARRRDWVGLRVQSVENDEHLASRFVTLANEDSSRNPTLKATLIRTLDHTNEYWVDYFEDMWGDYVFDFWEPVSPPKVTASKFVDSALDGDLGVLFAPGQHPDLRDEYSLDYSDDYFGYFKSLGEVGFAPQRKELSYDEFVSEFVSRVHLVADSSDNY